MIKIGTKKDLDKIAHLPINVRNFISEDVQVLDCFYGEDRNIDIHIDNFNKNFDLPEFTEEICPYKKMLFISGTERNIIVYEKM